jgi:hypothetical protein
MEVKLFELRDAGTFIPMIAIKLQHGSYERMPFLESERFLLRRAGYSAQQIDPVTNKSLQPYVLFGRLDGGGKLHYDPFAWDNRRTFGTAHMHLIEHWDELPSGAVIDVEFIAGHTAAPKISERLTVPSYED